MTTTTHLRPTVLQSTALAHAPDLKAALDFEIAHRCRGKVTKRLALKLALAVLSDAKGGMFYAERIAHQIQARLKLEAALKEIYLERETK